MVKAIIFDCFGVLATEGWTAFKTEHFGHSPDLSEQVTRISNRADAGLISHKEAVGLTASLAGVTADEVSKTMHNNVPNEPLFEYIRELKKNLKIGMLSNAAANWLEEIFEPSQLGLFDTINLSFESGFIKPDRRAYEAIAAQLDVKIGECIFVDDLEVHLRGAREAGMQTILYSDVVMLRHKLDALLKA